MVNTMQEANRLQKALKKDGPTFGTFQTLPGANLSRLIARSGVDWICVDMEHGNIDDGQMHELVPAISACGVSPIVRIASNETWMVKRALDAGAHGICVPLLNTVEDAKRLVSSAKFPPQGTRGFGSPFPAGTFNNEPMTEYLQQANDALLTIVQIETSSALENVSAIAAVPGIDVLLVGPFDLGNNIGHPILDGSMHQELQDAIAKVQRVAKENGKWSAMFCTSGEQAREFAGMGFDMVSVAGDMVALPAWFKQELGKARG